MLLSELCKVVGCEFSGEDFEVSALNALRDATPSEVSFVANAKYIADIETTKAGAVLVQSSLASYLPKGTIALVVDHPYLALAEASGHFSSPLEDESLEDPIIGEGSIISPKAYIAKGVVVGKNTTIMAGAYVGAGASVGDECIIYPNVTIYKECIIGSNCVIHANSVIGSDGFGFATNGKGEHKKIYQNGNVIIEDSVEIGSCTTIDRAVFGSTTIKQGVRIDNLVQVGHNCVIGEYSVLVAQAGISGSTTMGRNVVMGGQSATSGHLEIAPFTTMAARSGVTKSIKTSGKTYAGFPLFEHKEWLKLQAKIAKLLK